MWKIYLLPFAVLLMAFDQLSKWWVIEVFFRPRVMGADGKSLGFFDWLFTLGQNQFPSAREDVMTFFNLVMVWNKGVSFGMFASHDEIMPFILGGSALLFCGILFIWLVRARHVVTAIPLVMIIAGAVSNVWDRVRFGAVADFLDFHLGDIHYPAFNIADCCIVVGVLLLAFDGLVLEPRRMAQELSKNKSSATDVTTGVLSL